MGLNKTKYMFFYFKNFLGVFIDEVFIKDMQLSPDMQSNLATAAKNQRIA